MFRSVALVAVVALTIGCGSFSAAEKPADDAGVTGTDAATGGDSAVTSPDAGAGSPCKVADPSIVFCEDFDDPAYATPPFRFAHVTIDPSDSGQIALASAGVGGTNGVLFRVASAAGSRSVWLERDLGIAVPSKIARYELAYDVKVTATTRQYVVLGTFAFFGSGYSLYPGVAAFTKGASLGATVDPSASDPMFTTNVVGVWHHGVVTVTRGATAYDVQITIDGAPVGKPGPIEMNRVDDVRIQLGAFFTSPEAGQAELVLDNVVVRSVL